MIFLSSYQIALTDIMAMSVKKFVGIVKTFHSVIMSTGLAWTVVNLGTERNIANKVWNITLLYEFALFNKSIIALNLKRVVCLFYKDCQNIENYSFTGMGLSFHYVINVTVI